MSQKHYSCCDKDCFNLLESVGKYVMTQFSGCDINLFEAIENYVSTYVLCRDIIYLEQKKLCRDIIHLCHNISSKEKKNLSEFYVSAIIFMSQQLFLSHIKT